MDADANANANADAGGSTIALRELRSGELKIVSLWPWPQGHVREWGWYPVKFWTNILSSYSSLHNANISENEAKPLSNNVD